MIRLADNWQVCVCVFFVVFFFGLGALLKAKGEESAPIFFDAGKLALGVTLGLMKGKSAK